MTPEAVEELRAEELAALCTELADGVLVEALEELAVLLEERVSTK